MLSVRVNTFNENGLGEPEQDANSALTELDKGLRSSKVGEQCESIVRFPKLFEKYPFPILINASLLKLADVFRMGNNFLRLCVLRVCQQSEKHLDKISSVDEFVRRIYTVIHSNDPIARAITLRTFGAVAAIIPERQQIHHSIRSSLDSHDNVEVEASVFSAIQFAAQSKTFAISMCNKVSDMIQGQSTPANLKIKLIPILQYMHHDTNTALMVRSLCLNLLPSYPAKDFVLITLKTLTKLAAATLVDVSSQVLLLLKYLEDDPRWEVKSKCLEYLYELAKPGVYLWPLGSIDSIIDFSMKTNINAKALKMALDVILVLVESPQMCYNYYKFNSKLRQLCEKNSFSNHSMIAIQSIQILTEIICYCYKENLKTEAFGDIILSLETQILMLTHSEKDNLKQLKLVLKCAVKLCEAKKNHCERFVDLVGTRIQNVDTCKSIIICETLCAIGSLNPETLVNLLENIIEFLLILADEEYPTDEQIRLKIMLCTIIFQSLCNYKWNERIEETIFNITENNNLWANYCIGRAAVRYGHHKIGFKIFESLTELVSSEHFHFWLVCLKEMCEAETVLLNNSMNLVDKLEEAIVHYNRSIAALKAASTPSHILLFQAEYMKIRAEFLQCLVQMIYTCNILCIVPPPAIAAAIVQSTRDEFQRHGYITNQLRKCMKEFKNCGELYWKLYQTAFDADPATLENMQILQQMCILMEQSIQNICITGGQNESLKFQQNVLLESQQLISSCQNAVRVCLLMTEESSGSTITHKQIEYLKKIVEIFANASLPIPRYFFQVLQSTSVKLAISPQPRVMGEFISVQANSHLAVKVEGVIQHGLKPGLFRKIEQVVICVSSQIQSNSKIKEFENKDNNSSTLTQTVKPHKDFFTAQFLLAFPRGGQYLLIVEASVIDEQSNIWKTGPKSTLSVKVPEETKLAPIPVPGMVGNSNVILMQEDNLFIRPFQKK